MVATRAVRADTLGSSRCGSKGRRREGRATLSPDSRALLKGVRGVFFTESLLKPMCLGGRSPALCPRSLRRAPRPGLPELPAGTELRCGSASAPPSFVPERPRRERPGAQNHPRQQGARLVLSVSVWRRQSLRHQKKQCERKQNETKAHSEWVRLQLLLRGLS